MYAISLLAVPRFLMKGKTVGFWLSVLGAAAVVLYGRVKWLELINWVNYDFVGTMPVSKVLKNVIRDYAVIALAICLYIIDDWRKKRDEAQQLMESKTRAEIALLKQQLHPHFLFNTLNNIYSLVLSSPSTDPRAAESVLKLSRLMEYLVYRAGEKEVPITEEFALIEDYIDLERLRHGPALEVKLTPIPNNTMHQLPPLLLLPLVENCFKHGSKDPSGRFLLEIAMDIKQQTLCFSTKNSLKERLASDAKKQGTGLQNLRERLAILYPAKHSLELREENGFFIATLIIDLK